MKFRLELLLEVVFESIFMNILWERRSVVYSGIELMFSCYVISIIIELCINKKRIEQVSYNQ